MPYLIVVYREGHRFDCVLDGQFETREQAQKAIKRYIAEDKQNGTTYEYEPYPWRP